MHYDTIDSAINNLDSEDVARHIAAGANINQLYAFGDDGYVTLLILFASNGERKHVEFLLNHGADPNIADSNGETPLHEAASNDHFEIAAILLARRASPNLKNKHGWTPLHIAAAKGHLKIAQLLIAMSADRQALNNIGATALLLAANNGKGEVAKLLAAPLELKTAIARDIENARRQHAR